MRYECLPCPVCTSLFGEKDDVVVCPICGTPHHRSCWNKIGHCANKDKHSSDFVWESPLKDIVPKEIKETEPKMHEKMPEKVTVFPKSMQNMSQQETEEIMKMAGYRPIDGEEKIGDLKVKEYGEYVDKNKHKYIPKFYTMDRTKRKVTWNWSAFFFAVPWLFYRKMVNIGIILAIFTTIIPVVFAGDFVEYTNDVMEVMASIPVDATKQEIAQYAEKMPEVPLSFSVTEYVYIGVMLFCGMFGNYFYMKKATQDITKLKGDYTDPNVYALELKKKGSVSAWRTVAIIVILYLAFDVALVVAQRTGYDISFYIDKIISVLQK